MSEQEHVLNEAGEFDVHDEPVDISHYRFEHWAAFTIFWILAIVIFYQFFTRYALNDSASWTEEIARYLLILPWLVPLLISLVIVTYIPSISLGRT